MNAFKADINESAKIISGQNEKDKEPTYKRRRHESIDSQESIPNKPKKSRKDSNSEGQKADSNPEEDREEDMEEKTGDENDQEKKDSNPEEDREEDVKDLEEKTGDENDQEKKDSNPEEDREEDVKDLEEKTGDGDDHKHDDKEYIDEDNGMETGEENLDETAAEIDAVQKITAKSSNDEDHDTSIN